MDEPQLVRAGADFHAKIQADFGLAEHLYSARFS
jgi:hypothetical protein